MDLPCICPVSGEVDAVEKTSTLEERAAGMWRSSLLTNKLLKSVTLGVLCGKLETYRICQRPDTAGSTRF